MSAVQRVFPFLAWLPRLKRFGVRHDVIAGLTGAVVVLPQGLAFAAIAGMPPEYGLYAAMVPAAIAALFGSSWHLVSGPTLVISLVTFATMSPLAEPGSAQYVGLVLTLTLLVGVIQLAMGVARMGVLVNYVSHTVVIAFTSGAGILIITNQLRNFLGIDISRGASFLQIWTQLLGSLADVKPFVAATGVLTVAAAFASRRWLPRLPYMIVAMVVATLAATAVNLWLGQAHTGIQTIGPVSGALPPLSLPAFQIADLRAVLAAAIAIAVLGLTEAVSIAKAIAVRSEQRIDASQEFTGQGLSNLVGAFFSAYPSSGSFNRSGLNYDSGARTPFSALTAAIALPCILFAIAPLVAYLPIAAMAGVLLIVGWNLIDMAHMRRIVRSGRSEVLVLSVTLFATLFTQLEFAILFGVTVSLATYLYRSSRPRIYALLPDAGDAGRRFVAVPGGRKECPQLKIARVEGPLFFGAVDHVSERLDALAPPSSPQKHLLLTCRGVNLVDVAGAEYLVQEARRRSAQGGSLYLYGVRDGVRDYLHNGGFDAEIGADRFYRTKREAIAGIYRRLDSEICKTCSVKAFQECHVRLPSGDPVPATAAPA